SNAARKQQIIDKAAGKKPKAEQDLTIWDALGVHCSANERRADEASRDVEAWLKCYFIRNKLGEEFSGTISGVTQFGIFVQLDDIYIEGLVHITELGADYFQFDDARHELRGERTGKRYQLADKIKVQVSRVDLDARKIDLAIVPASGAAARIAPAADARGNSGATERAKAGKASVGKAGVKTNKASAKAPNKTAAKAASPAANSRSGKPATTERAPRAASRSGKKKR
ncbi:S1 RNA-binding domain-containing protein, partial [Undibacterium sp. 10I3]